LPPDETAFEFKKLGEPGAQLIARFERPANRQHARPKRLKGYTLIGGDGIHDLNGLG
jgi:hypothetical protein